MSFAIGNDIFIEMEEDEEAAKLLPESSPDIHEEVKLPPKSEPGQKSIAVTREGITETENSNDPTTKTQGMFH